MDYRLYKFRRFYRAYINDIIIFSRMVEEYIRYVLAILKLFEDINLGINPKKSFFGFLSI